MATRQTILVGLSGGVDSSVAALLLKQQGHEVIGVTMRIYSDAIPIKSRCSACYGPDEDDVAQAQEVCETLGIPHHTVDLRQEYKDTVLGYFRDEYLAGRTPNPCVRCNHRIKFGVLLQRAEESGVRFDRFATGHYARLAQDATSGRHLLQCAVDKRRDQAYFLCMLTQVQLGRLLFPLGELTKDRVRELAREHGLTTHSRPDSQDFVAGDYTPLLGVEEQPGPIRNTKGEVIGEHRGVWLYTIGQRRGIGIAQQPPLYVLRIDAAANTIVVGMEEELFTTTLTARDMNWIGVETPRFPFQATAKIRSFQTAVPCAVRSGEAGRVVVEFPAAQRAVTPGQVLVLYDGDTVLGGGIIE
ncbi:MAG: tRNA 2-thiouridine(34) synthase MnmA [Lentisphaerae bacterium RIFOXYB12_FULL_65_16]|nr:MAG: tRNA 2-thiouridine(34) synthase MnmA [Lentisphaerae bacterium RIFOXYA12_64_32]OGV87900.1 MAG: tRNA 2-thiouridine(34) synthase MnmA [Lentisphaerae bacterium RIFOXYB12_FULL_65_16]